jgi:hypothetical protein
LFLLRRHVAGHGSAPPDYHLFAAHKAPWFDITDTLPCYAGDCDGAAPCAINRLAVPLPERASDGPVTGSCLCGAVAYQLGGELEQMRTCQCSRCRRNSGSAYFVPLPAPADKLVFLRGEDRVRTFALPSARYYICNFCSDCGSPVPGKLPGVNRTVASAGTVDGDPGVRIRYHIFWASRASWCERHDELPKFEAMPPRDFVATA